MKTVIRTIVVLAILAIAGGIAFIYSGLYNVSAIPPDNPFVTWAMSTAMDRSVHRHARGMTALNLEDPKMVSRGAASYAEDCVLCHGEVGQPPSETAKGLRPTPPELWKTARNWSPAELGWIIRNGVRMTGMPAWGPSYEDEELWSVVAYVARLPQTPAKPRAPEQAK